MNDFKDHFSGHAGAYADYRPTYPDALFAAIAQVAPARRAVWDVGCGNGQASVGLARHFDHVFATDASAQQIAAAQAHERIDFRAAPAEHSGLDAASVDAILIAQALHWFDFDAFYAEARRVAKPGAPIIATAYELAQIAPEIDAEVRQFYKADIGPYWPADRAHVETGYQEIPWPFAPLNFTAISMNALWSLDQWLGYVTTWSAVRRYMAATGKDPVPALRAQLKPLWGNTPRAINWPLVIKAGRI
ncbi:MAG: methyltransferase domain-containing protein [Alphaproteobacteria bacterium]|nr:methyltransferase domain-containing protein [Alphaproteobacteria bacterium]MDE2341367.1 methyltransferase domain-containing protein [Alphaproteobacteria bacterium]